MYVEDNENNTLFSGQECKHEINFFLTFQPFWIKNNKH